CLDFAHALAGQPSAQPPPPKQAQRAVPDPAPEPTAPLNAASERVPSAPPKTKRLDLMTVYGTAQAVQRRPAGPDQDGEVLAFRVERYESTGRAHTVVPVEIPVDADEAAPPRRRRGWLTIAAVIGLITVVVASLVFVTHGFGLWSNNSGPGPVVKPERA